MIPAASPTVICAATCLANAVDHEPRKDFLEARPPGRDTDIIPRRRYANALIWVFVENILTPSIQGPFSLQSQAAGLPNSGADGSFIVYPDELTRDLNHGLQTIAGLLRPLPEQFNVSAGDVVHLAGTIGLLAFVGRPPPRHISPDGFLPNSADTIEFLTERFANMGFTAREMMTLVGVHSVGKQMFIDPEKINATFDTTPDLLDTRFWAKVLRRVRLARRCRGG
ncbi:heme peroxidase [Mycena leptocephala]|nr:heme peroxidase [Mycena leptocephala]